MEVQLEERLLRLREVIGEGRAEVTVEENLRLPGALPSMERIVDACAFPRITHREVLENTVTLEGRVDWQIVYAAPPPGEPERAEGSAGAAGTVPVPAYSFAAASTFRAVVEVRGARPGAAVHARLEVLGREAELADGRSVDVRLDLGLAVSVAAYREARVATAAQVVPPGSARVYTERLRVERSVGEAQTSLVVREDLSLDDASLSGLPPVGRVLLVRAQPRLTEVRVTGDEVLASGIVDLVVLYAPEEGPIPATWAHFARKLPFQARLAVPGAREGMRVRVQLAPERVDVRRAGARLFRAEVVVGMAAAVVDPALLTLVTGLESLASEGVETYSETLALPISVAEERLAASAGGELLLSPGQPPIQRILGAYGTALVDTVHLGDGFATVAGRVAVTLFYTSEGEEGRRGLFAARFHEGIPFEHQVELPAAGEGARLEAEVEVLEVRARPVGEDAATCDADLLLALRATARQEVDAVLDAVVVPAEEERPPSIVFVRTQPGDTYWRLARRFRTRVEEILAANPGLDPDHLAAGTGIFIPRRSPSP